MNPSAPAIAMGKPQAAEVPTAFCMVNPNRLKNGTVKLPPPMPKIADAAPISPPTPNCTLGLGKALGVSAACFLQVAF